jgi:hypothetical protein
MRGNAKAYFAIVAVPNTADEELKLLFVGCRSHDDD